MNLGGLWRLVLLSLALKVVQGASLVRQFVNVRSSCELRPTADHLLKEVPGSLTLDLLKLWDVLQSLLLPIWPKDRTTIDGVPIGDAWPLSTLQRRSNG